TVFEGYGGYLKENKVMAYIIINKYQIMKLKRIVNNIDENAFIVIHDVRDVSGGSFAWMEKYAGRAMLPCWLIFSCMSDYTTRRKFIPLFVMILISIIFSNNSYFCIYKTPIVCINEKAHKD